ncbi:Aste57867_16791 [Aphanomyces stellatus]|uniref:Amino acid transporter n=1 Tax=Aphanomyces stellatus TaxID=120398 RepID=A0A485L765_9STRA|nr:hypothetical protein As57867_016734 [Aphanomyces stellatus]VFT93556.1 Aste57867_16791 [Aphanomyces stellatus]
MASTSSSATAGILLYDGQSRDRQASATNPSSNGTAKSNRPRNTPHESYNLRTNFTTQLPPETPASLHHLQSAYDEYKISPSPILGDQVPLERPPTAGISGYDDDGMPLLPSFNPLAITAGAVAGLGFGILFFYLHLGPEWQKVLTLPGNLYIRALRCLIVPMVFCVLTIVVAENVSMGRTSIFRLRTLVPFLASGWTATAQGAIIAYVFKGYFATGGGGGSSIASPPANAVATAFNLTMQCANGLYLASTPTGLACAAPDATNATFMAHSLAASAGVGASMNQLSLMDQVTAILNLMVTSNILTSLVNGDLLSIVLFCFPLGYVVAKSTDSSETNHVLSLLRQLRNLFLLLLFGLLRATPVAIAVLLASAIAAFDANHLDTMMTQIGYYFASFLVGVFTHNMLVLPALVFAWTRANPFAFMAKLVPAYLFAFSCASSMATLPLAVACIQRAAVSRHLALVTMPFGTPANMNGCALYYPISVVFMASTAGLADQLTISRWAIIVVVGWMGSMGTAPVPHAGLVYVLTLWSTCFPAVPLPPSFSILVAADFIFDRIATAMNVNGNAMVTRILADQVDETFEVTAAQQQQQHVVA